MQVLVLYYSITGNTKRLAEEIVRGVSQVEGVDSVLRSTSEVTKEDFLNSEAVVAGSPTYFGSMAAPLKEIFDSYIPLRKRMENKIGAAFATSSDPSGGLETTMLSILHAMLIYGMAVVGDPLDATGHYGVACSGNLDDSICENAHKLGRRVAWLTKKFSESGP